MAISKRCAASGEVFEVSDDDLRYLELISPVFAGTRCKIAPPALSPQTRFRRRLAFRNERFLYHRRCDLTGRNIISIFPPDSPYKVYDQDAWWSDAWDARSYGRDFNPSRPFFEQLAELSLSVPHMSLYTRNVENSYYTNYAVNLKNCYLAFGTLDSEDVLYGRYVWFSRDVVDGFWLTHCELCYEGISGERCYNCKYFMNCRDCSDCMFVEDCQSCRNCALCFGLHKKEYHVLNEDVGKAGYEEFLQSVYPLSHGGIEALQKKLKALKLGLPHRSAQNYRCENCRGDGLVGCKNCHFCFDCIECEEGKDLYLVSKGKQSRDGSFAGPYGPEFSYEFCSSTGATRSLGIFLCWLCDSAFYSIECQSSKNIFGCVGMRHNEYCILNKQYTRDEYERLALVISRQMQQSGEWGEFVPFNLSCFGYNQTAAQEYFPETREGALARGWNWTESQAAPPADPSLKAPGTIEETGDHICKGALSCRRSGKRYKITPQELLFYRKMQIPVPLLCPDERHNDRVAARTPRRLWKRQCAKTGETLWTPFSPDRPEIVYGDQAYRDWMY